MIVKICGITRLEDALAAAGEGADAVGFVFVSSSPRYVDPVRAREIIRRLPPRVLPVGVFADAPEGEIAGTVEETGIRCVQLHGEEPPEISGRLRVTLWKAFRVAGGFDVSALRHWRADAYVLDTFVPGRKGGTGVTFDWTVAAKVAALARVVLAGGLSPGNVQKAVKAARPYGVDVSSGVELSPGVKDHGRIREFVTAARRAQRLFAIP